MKNVIDAARVAAITDAMFATCMGAKESMNEAAQAAEASKDAAKSAVSVRESVMFKIAEISLVNDWQPVETKLAAKAAGARTTNLATAGSLAVFISECSRAAHPLIRERFHEIVALRNDAWDTEEMMLEADKASPAPVRKAFKRRYHALIGIMSAIEKGENLSTVEDVISYAVAHDPDHDAAKVLKRLKGLVSDLSDFYGDFPVDDIGHAIQTLQNVTADILTAARNAKIAENKALCATSAAAATPAVTAPKAAQTVVNKPTIVPTQPKVASKASAFQVNTVQVDVDTDLLGDNLADAAD